MKKLFQKIRSRVTLKLMLVSSLTAVVPLMIIGVIITNHLYRQNFGQAIENSSKMLQDKAGSVDEKIQELLSIATIALTDDDLRQLMKRDNQHMTDAASPEIGANYALYDNYVVFRDFFYKMQIMNAELCDITLITAREIYFAFRDYQILDSGFKETYKTADWFINARNNPYTPAITGRHTPYQGLNSNLEVITVIRPIADYIKSEYLGTLLVDAQVSVFAKILRNESGDGSVFFLVDGRGETILSGSPAVSLPAEVFLSHELGGPSGYVPYTDPENKTDYFLSYCLCENTGWKIVQLLPKVPLVMQSISSTLLIILLFAIVALLIICGTGIMVSSFTRPLGIITDDLRSVGKGDLGIAKSRYDGRHDEIGQLIHSINAMKTDLRDTIKKLSCAISKQKDAQMQALQSQINPHFIFNTLSSIQMTAKLNHDEEAVYLLENLGTLFKNYIRINRVFVTIEEELQLIETYVNIQRVRYSDKFDVIYDISRDIRGLYILKFLLQPVIENSIMHGFENIEKNGRIVIAAAKEQDCLTISITDNGTGMTEDKLRLLNGRLTGRTAPDDGDGVGLLNVHSRLQLYFGTPYRLEVKSHEHMGTTVTIKIPALEAPLPEGLFESN